MICLDSAWEIGFVVFFVVYGGLNLIVSILRINR